MKTKYEEFKEVYAQYEALSEYAQVLLTRYGKIQSAKTGWEYYPYNNKVLEYWDIAYGDLHLAYLDDDDKVDYDVLKAEFVNMSGEECEEHLEQLKTERLKEIDNRKEREKEQRRKTYEQLKQEFENE